MSGIGHKTKANYKRRGTGGGGPQPLKSEKGEGKRMGFLKGRRKKQAEEILFWHKLDPHSNETSDKKGKKSLAKALKKPLKRRKK